MGPNATRRAALETLKLTVLLLGVIIFEINMVLIIECASNKGLTSFPFAYTHVTGGSACAPISQDQMSL